MRQAQQKALANNAVSMADVKQASPMSAKSADLTEEEGMEVIEVPEVCQ